MVAIEIMYFINTTGIEREEFPIEVAGTVQLMEVLADVAKKLNLGPENIAVAPPGGSALTPTEYNLNVSEIIKRFGDHLNIINRGIVGATN